MGTRDKTIYIDSDNLVTLSGLTDTDGYVNDAVVKLSIVRSEPQSCKAAVVVDKSGGKVGIPVTGHGLATGDHIRVIGTDNLNAEYDLDAASSTDEIVVTATYVAETLTTSAKIYHGFPDAAEISMDYLAASDGIYTANVPETVHLFESLSYYSFISVVDGENKKLIRTALRANYATG